MVLEPASPCEKIANFHFESGVWVASEDDEEGEEEEEEEGGERSGALAEKGIYMRGRSGTTQSHQHIVDRVLR